MTPEAIRRRMAHGNIYPAERIDAALGNYFRERQPVRAARARAAVGGRPRRRGARSSTGPATGSSDRGRPASGWSSRSPARPAATTWCGGPPAWPTRTQSDLVGVHVRADDGVRSAPEELLDQHRTLLAQLGGRYLEVVRRRRGRRRCSTRPDPRARPSSCSARRGRSRLAELTSGSVINRVLRGSGPIDVHVISTAGTRTGAAPLAPERRPQRRSRRAGGCSGGCSRSSRRWRWPAC